MTSKADFFQLASNWTPSDRATGILMLTLTNLSGRPIKNFRLAFTSHCRLEPGCQLEGAALIEQTYGYHVLAPPVGLVLTHRGTWSVTVDRLNYAPRHYTEALKSAYLVLEDGGIVPVGLTPTMRNFESGAPRLEAPSRSGCPQVVRSSASHLLPVIRIAPPTLSRSLFSPGMKRRGQHFATASLAYRQ